MRKQRLNLDDLGVESFEIRREAEGTVVQSIWISGTFDCTTPCSGTFSCITGCTIIYA